MPPMRKGLHMCVRHSVMVIGHSILFVKIVGLLLGNHVCDGAMPLTWPTQTASPVAVGHHDGVLQH